jgi:hypothetical protein
MSNASYNIYIDWNGDGDFDDTGEEVTSRMMQLEWTLGLDFASNSTERAARNSAVIVLNNTSGDYSPFNAAGPLYGNLLPGRTVQINASSSSNPFGSFPYTFPFNFNNPRWTGKIESIDPESFVNRANIAIIKAVDPLTYVAADKLQLVMQGSQASGALVGAILDSNGWPSADRVIDTGQITITRFSKDGAGLMDALHDVEETEDGRIYGDRFGRVVFEDRDHRAGAPHTTSQATFSDGSGAALSYGAIRQEDPLPQIFNVIPVTVTTYTVGSLSVLWTNVEAGVNSPSIAVGASRVFWAVFPVFGSANDDYAVDAWTTTTATTDFTANSLADGTGTDLTADIGIVNVKYANAMKITLTNNHATLTAFIGPTGGQALQARGTPVVKNDPMVLQVEDATSQTAYGKRVFRSAGKWFSTSAAAQTQIDTLLARYKDPRARLSLTIVGNRDDTHLNQVLDRTISDRITVVANNDAGLGINQDFFIEAERHRVNAHLRHEVTWRLTPA